MNCLCPNDITLEFYQMFKEDLIPIVLKLFRNTEKAFKLILQSQRYPDTKTKQGHNRKENYRPMPLINIDTIILNKIVENQIQQCIKRITYTQSSGIYSGM